ncbi:MATE family efflux transporter [Oceanospirillum sediminis]
MSLTRTKPDLLKDPIAPLLFRMTLPVMGGIITLMLFNLVDAWFISQLGTAPLAAVTFTFPVTFTIISLSIGLGIGTSAVVGKLLGEKSFQLVKRRVTDAAVLAVVLSLLLTVAGWVSIDPLFRFLGASEDLIPWIHDYMSIWYLGTLFVILPRVMSSALRASGNTLVPGLVMIASGVVNGILDPILIFGYGPIPAMGVKGAALATLIAWCVLTLGIFSLKDVRQDLLSFVTPRWQEVKESWAAIGHIALPAVVSSILTPISAAMLTRIVAGFGHEAVASYGVGSRIESVSLIIVFAMSMTVPPFVSQNMGAGQFDRVRQGVFGSFRFVIIWQAVIWGLLLLFERSILNMFASDSPVLSENLSWFLWSVPLGLGMQGIIILANSTMNALHEPMVALKLSFLRLFIFYVPICMLGAWLAGLHGLFWGAVVANILMCGISLLTVRKYLNAVSLAENYK